MMTYAVIAVSALMASAQSTGQMSPTSDVSGNRVRATGAAQARALRDHLRTLPDSRITATGGSTAQSLADIAGNVLDAGVMRPVKPRIAARGVNAARAIGLRAIMRSRATFGSVDGVAPGVGYNALWIRDYYMMASAYPGYFTAAVLRPVVDAFVEGIGSWSGGGNYSPERIETDGTLTYKPGVAPGAGSLPAFDNAPYLVLLASLAHERGDTTVYTTHGSRLALALAAAPRDASGLIYSGPSYTVGWGFEDGIPLLGGLGMVSALHAQAYRVMAEMAADKGDMTGVATYASAFKSLRTALRTLKRSDGFYNAATTETKPHVILTALIVAEGLCGASEGRDSSAALVSAWRAGLISQRGSIRHLVYPNYWTPGAMTQGTYQNGGYWLGQWVGWTARAMAVTDPGAAAVLAEEAVAEVNREQRIVGNAPFEWTNGSGGGATYYGAASGMFADLSDNPDTLEVSLAGTTSSSAIVLVSPGASIYQVEAISPVAATASIALYSAIRDADYADSISGEPLTFGAETVMGIVNLTGGVGGQIRSGLQSPSPFGGYVRAYVASGGSTQPITIRLRQTPNVPTIGSPSVLYADTFDANHLASDYTSTGTWSVSDATLINTTASTFSVAVADASLGYSQAVSVQLTSADFATRYPGVVLRYVDDDNMIYALAAGFVVNVYDRIGGSDTLIGSIGGLSWNAGTFYSVTMSVIGNRVTGLVTGGPPNTWTTSVLSAGKAGVRAGLSSSTQVSFQNLSITAPFQAIPPGYVLEYGGTTGLLTGEDYSAATGTTNLRCADGSIVSSTSVSTPSINY